jgi:hypothetical protein
MSISYIQASIRNISSENAWKKLSSIASKIGPHTSNLSCASAHPCLRDPTQEGEAALGISHIWSCYDKFYSGQLSLTADLQINAVHCNGRHSGLEGTKQSFG